MVKITQIDGDLAISRHLAMGGNATINGNATIGHNLRVEGYLDALHIRGSERGLYPTPEALQQAWPQPEDGWWALVGSSLPAALYMAQGGQWVDTGSTAGEISVEISGGDADVSALEGQLAAQASQISSLQNSVSSLSSSNALMLNRLSAAETALSSLSAQQAALATRIEALEEAEAVPCVIMFAGLRTSATIEQASSTRKSIDAGCQVVYVLSLGMFALEVQQSGLGIPAYYNEWADRKAFADANHLPYANKLYVNTSANAIYRADGDGNLVAL